MAKTVKNPEIRRAEILEAALNLFIDKGFEQTSVSDIVKAVGVAQGTFYYYFRTKDETVDAIIENYVSEVIDVVQPVVMEKNTGIFDKMEKMIYTEIGVNLRMISKLHRMRHIDIHAKTFTMIIRKLAPVYAEVIRQGVKEGYFRTEYPLETAEMILLNSHFLFDLGLFPLSREETQRRAEAQADTMEKILELEKGKFHFFIEAMMVIYENSEKGKSEAEVK